MLRLMKEGVGSADDKMVKELLSTKTSGEFLEGPAPEDDWMGRWAWCGEAAGVTNLPAQKRQGCVVSAWRRRM